jgi:NhaP-type Na+/H+ or K+/H+ antiporter
MHGMLPDILCLLIAAVGWFYMFYSRAARDLKELEARQINTKRVLCRRINGGVILLLGMTVFAGLQNLPPVIYLIVWLIVMMLLAICLVLGMVDLRLTWKLSRVRRRGSQ